MPARRRPSGQHVVTLELSSVTGAGTVYWITGLAAAGKTTLATGLVARLRRGGRPAVLLDGDRLRAVLAAEGANGAADRLRLAMTYARLAQEIAGQGIDAVCATISMFHAVRDWNRAHISSYREIYLRVPAEVLAARDPKGIYARHRAGAETQVVGQDLAPELPRRPDLVIDNDGTRTAEEAVDLIWSTQVIGHGTVAA